MQASVMVGVDDPTYVLEKKLSVFARCRQTRRNFSDRCTVTTKSTEEVYSMEQNTCCDEKTRSSMSFGLSCAVDVQEETLN